MKAIEDSINQRADSVSLGEIVSQMKHSGFGLVILFLCLPFLQPVPLAGLSTALGSAILILGFQLARGRKSVWLPDLVGNRKVEAKTGRALVAAAVKFFKVAEKFVKPRLSVVAEQERVFGVVICVMAMILMLPIPVPFSNLAAALPIAVLSCGLLERDGFMAIVGFGFSILGVAFHIALFFLGAEGLMWVWNLFGL